MSERPEPSYVGDAPFFFVSYAHADVALVHPEMRWLQEGGFNIWYDEGIHVGAVWRKAIADALTACAGLVFFATAASAESEHCLKELNFALDEGKPVFVVRMDDTRLPALLRLSLADRQMLNRTAFDEPAYRAKLTQALSVMVKPTRRAQPEAPEPRRIPTAVPTIAVQKLGAADPDTAFWAESLTDDLAVMLGHRPFRITTTHDQTRDVATLGRALDVGYVISGFARRFEDRCRVNLKLTKSGSGAQAWGARYEERGHALDAADSICRVAAVDISAAIIEDERTRLRGADSEGLDAWALCIQASSINLNTPRERGAAIELLREAAQRDPHFALAHAVLSVWLALSVVNLFSRSPEAETTEALGHADSALSLAPDNPLIMRSVALPHRVFGNEALALDLAQRASAAGGSDPLFGVRFAGGIDVLDSELWACLIQAGREGDAVEGMLAVQPRPERMLYTAYAALGRWDEAVVWAQRAAATYPNAFVSWIELANALAMVGRLDEARDVKRRALSMAPVFTLSQYERAVRLGWRNRHKLVESQLAGLRRLESA